MAQVRKSMLWMATLCALVGVAFVVAFLQTRHPQSVLLFNASVAASLSAAALFSSVVLVCSDAMSRQPMRARRVDLPKPEPIAMTAEPIALSAQLQRRQANLQERLAIDEPRYCTQSAQPCTCWSLCGSESAPPDDRAATTTNPHLTALPVVHRKGVAGCHQGLPASVEPVPPARVQRT